MRAAAVEAVRRGLRIAFSRPSRACTDNRRNGAPRAPAIGLAASGDSIATPMNVTAAPRPTIEAPLDSAPNKPYKSAAAPSAVTATATASRRPASDRDGGASSASRSAWIGATVPARRAGRIEAATVTTTPTTIETTTVRGNSWSAVLGRSMLNRPSNPCRPTAMPIPARIPNTDATSPTTNASTTTETIT